MSAIPISTNLLDMRCRMNIQHTKTEMIDMLMRNSKSQETRRFSQKSDIKTNQSIAYTERIILERHANSQRKKKHLTTFLNYDGIHTKKKKIVVVCHMKEKGEEMGNSDISSHCYFIIVITRCYCVPYISIGKKQQKKTEQGGT